MKKYVVIGSVVAVFLAGGLVVNYLSKDKTGQSAGNAGQEVDLTVHALKNQWRWDKDSLQVHEGDKVRLTMVNEDDYGHGIGIDGYGVNQPLPPGESTVVEFVATRKGTFTFYCSVPCGDGEVDGHERGHFNMTGTLQVI